MSFVLFRELLTANFLNGSYIIAEAEQTVQGQERPAHKFCTDSPLFGLAGPESGKTMRRNFYAQGHRDTEDAEKRGEWRVRPARRHAAGKDLGRQGKAHAKQTGVGHAA